MAWKRFLMLAVVSALAVTAMLGGFADASTVRTGGSEEKYRPLTAFVEKRMKAYGVEGAAVGVLKGGKLVFEGYFGDADVKNHQKVDPYTVFRIASISKPMAAMGFMKLVEAKKVSLDDSADRYLTRWHIPKSPYNEAGVTPRRLLSHTAGFNIEGNLGYDREKSRPPIEQVLNGEGKPDWAVKLVQEPGSTFRYSGGGYSVLQLMVEEITGIGFDDYMRSQVFRPLGMDHTGYEWHYEAPYHLSQAYGAGHPIDDRPWAALANGGVYTTLEDMARFVGASSYGGKGLVSDSTKREMYTAQPNTKSIYGVYGLGFIPERVGPKGVQIVSHSGDITGWNSAMVFQPELGDGIVVLTNSDAGYYFKSEIAGYWTQNQMGGKPADARFVESMDRTLGKIAICVGAVAALISIFALMRWKRCKDTAVPSKSQSPNVLLRKRVKARLQMGLSLTVAAGWLFGAYTPWPCKWLYGLNDYYLYTFFTPNFIWITMGVLWIMGLVFSMPLLTGDAWRKTGNEQQPNFNCG